MRPCCDLDAAISLETDLAHASGLTEHKPRLRPTHPLPPLGTSRAMEGRRLSKDVLGLNDSEMEDLMGLGESQEEEVGDFAQVRPRGATVGAARVQAPRRPASDRLPDSTTQPYWCRAAGCVAIAASATAPAGAGGASPLRGGTACVHREEGCPRFTQRRSQQVGLQVVGSSSAGPLGMAAAADAPRRTRPACRRAVPPSRWEVDVGWPAGGGGQLAKRFGAFVDGAELFDHAFFGFAAGEVRAMCSGAASSARFDPLRHVPLRCAARELL